MRIQENYEVMLANLLGVVSANNFHFKLAFFTLSLLSPGNLLPSAQLLGTLSLLLVIAAACLLN